MENTNSSDEDIGLAQRFYALANLAKLESVINTAIENSKVPVSETRKLLKSETTNQVQNTAVFQFMQDLFREIGLGQLGVVNKDNFTMILSNKNSPVNEIYKDVKDKKTCYIVADALAEFFTEDMSIPSEVEETECKNAGDPNCLFRVDLQPLAVYRIALDETDEKIIDCIKKGMGAEEISSELGLVKDELDYRLETLKSYHVLENDMTLTKIGQTYYKYGKSLIERDTEEIEPPWKTMSQISSKIADTESFAEALRSSVDDSVSEEDIKDSEVVNLLNEADRSSSFAQLVSKTVKGGKEKKDKE